MTTTAVMMLDASLPLTFQHPVHPDGTLWPEKHQELVILATEARYESDDDLREKALLEYRAASKGIAFQETTYVAQHTFMLGAAYAGVEPEPTFSIHPTNWLQTPPDLMAKFRLLAPYEWIACDTPAYHDGHAAGLASAPFEAPDGDRDKDEYGRGYCKGVFEAHQTKEAA